MKILLLSFGFWHFAQKVSTWMEASKQKMSTLVSFYWSAWWCAKKLHFTAKNVLNSWQMTLRRKQRTVLFLLDGYSRFGVSYTDLKMQRKIVLLSSWQWIFFCLSPFLIFKCSPTTKKGKNMMRFLVLNLPLKKKNRCSCPPLLTLIAFLATFLCKDIQ